MKPEETEFKKNADEITKYNEKARYYIDLDEKPYDFSMFSDDYQHSVEAIKYLLLEHTDLINHSRRSLMDGSGAWYEGETFDNMVRQIHQDDKKRWFSYDTKVAETKKLSMYQYQNPYEEFAEAFSVYYMCEDDNERKSRMPEGLKKWFDTNNFNIERSRDKYKS